MKMNGNYWYLYLFGILGSMYVGAIFPIFAFLLSKIIDILAKIKNTTDMVALEGFQQDAMDLSLAMLAISFGGLFIISLRGISFTFLTERLGFILKKNSFEKSINNAVALVHIHW